MSSREDVSQLHLRGFLKPYRFLTLACLMTAGACNGDTTGPGNDCGAVALPLSGSTPGPVIVAVSLEVQPSGVVVLATATDPQGTENLLGVDQSISVFPNARCTGTPIVLHDDLAGSGVEESFGTVVTVDGDPALYGAIAAAVSWPVTVDFRDRDGNRTTGGVMATVIDEP